MIGRAATALARVAIGAAAAFAVAVLLAIVAPMVVGWRSLTVMSGSMEPAISTGDVVVNRPVPASDVRPGQVVTFRDPKHSGRTITHRVRRAVTTDGTVGITTQGDANTGTETWSIPSDGRVGLVAYRVPVVGYALHPIASPLGRLGLVGLPLLLWGALSVRAVWREDTVQPDEVVPGHA